MMRLSHISLSENALPEVVLYHGTLKSSVRPILQKGLQSTSGWGGANTEGVYLSGSIDGAAYWALYAYAREHESDMDVPPSEEEWKALIRERSKRHIAVLEIRVPPEYQQHLRADMEQAEDVQYTGTDEDWQEALKQIGDVRYTGGTIPPQWISEVRM